MSSRERFAARVAAPQTNRERGAALITALLIMALVAGISMCVLATVSTEVRVAGSDLQRTQTFYAASAGIEKMTSDFSSLFQHTTHPTQTQLNNIAASSPPELTGEGFVLNQTLVPDDAALNAMRADQGIANGAYPVVTIPNGPFAGLLASISPYKVTSTATMTTTSSQVRLEREMNNYLIPLFQFGMFSNNDISLHPGPPFVFNGRIHTNSNLYLNGDVTMLDKVTVANELVYDVLRNNSSRTGANVRMLVGNITVPLTMGSVRNGPNFPGAVQGQRGYFPGSPNGSDNTSWKSSSVAPAQSGQNNRFGGQLLTRTTGASKLLLPLELGGNPSWELIKRSVAGEELLDDVLSQSRFANKAQIRVLIDDETTVGDAAGIPAGQGLPLSSFDPIALDGGNALRVVKDDGTYDPIPTKWSQGTVSGKTADTVRGIRSYKTSNRNYEIYITNSSDPLNAKSSDLTDKHNTTDPSSSCTDCAKIPKGPNPNSGFIPPGSGIKGRILIEIVDPNGTARDVTREVLSMGMTEGEPNGIFYLQRPLWAAFMQGARDRDGGKENLEFLTSNSASRCIADGEINETKFDASIDANAGYYKPAAATDVDDPSDAATSGAPYMPTKFIRNDVFDPTKANAIVPINVYNPREGWISNSLNEANVYSRGMTSVIEINMRNLARWVDGIYDNTLLRGTSAVSANINGSDGYILYVSDRRGDILRTEGTKNGTFTMTNGMDDNEDIYGPNGTLDPGEDVINAGTDSSGNPRQGTLQKDTRELPDPSVPYSLWNAQTTAANRLARAKSVEGWLDLSSIGPKKPDGTVNPYNYFRRAVRLFNGSNLQITGATGKLSQTKGITVSSENMVYIWGSYNTTGIAVAPPAGVATLNDGGYLGAQVPASIVTDAFFPLSRTWSDSLSAYDPEGGTGTTSRTADAVTSGALATTEETSVRAAIIAGDNDSALQGAPDAGNGADSRLNGGMHNFPRFLENWLSPQRRWNFVGSFCPLFHSTQAMGQWTYITQEVYGAPSRNWAFDTSFRNIFRLPPGTPMFQYIESTGFRQCLKNPTDPTQPCLAD